VLVRFTVRSTGDALGGDGEAVGPTAAGLEGANDTTEAAGARSGPEQPLTAIASTPTNTVTLRARMDMEGS